MYIALYCLCEHSGHVEGRIAVQCFCGDILLTVGTCSCLSLTYSQPSNMDIVQTACGGSMDCRALMDKMDEGLFRLA